MARNMVNTFLRTTPQPVVWKAHPQALPPITGLQEQHGDKHAAKASRAASAHSPPLRHSAYTEGYLMREEVRQFLGLRTP